MRNRTIHIVQHMSPGGIELLVRDLAHQLPGENQIFSLDGTRQQLIHAWPALAPQAKQVRGFAKKKGVRPWLLYQLYNIFKQLRPHAVITHHIGPLIYGGLAARFANVPVIAHVEHDVWHYGHAKQRMITKAVCSIVQPKIVGVSIKAADTLAKIVGAKDARVINNGVDVDRFTPKGRASIRNNWQIPEDVYVIGAVGRLEMVKGHDVLLEAMVGMPDNVLCVIVGSGSQISALQEQVERLGIDQKVRLLGNVPDTSLIYPAFDVLCLPSRSEGAPLSVLEAQACGVRVVATDVGSVRDVVCPDLGRLVPAEDAEALSASLIEILQNQEQASPRHFVFENFCWTKTLAAYSELVRG